MGIDVSAYAVYGIKIDYDDEFSDAYNDTDEPKDFSVIFDGMFGEYIVIGHVLFAAYLDEDAEFTEINVNDLKKYDEEIRTEFMKKFPNHYHLIDGKQFKLFAFVYYS